MLQRLDKSCLKIGKLLSIHKFIQLYEDEKNGSLDSVVTGDKIWVLNFDYRRKQNVRSLIKKQ